MYSVMNVDFVFLIPQKRLCRVVKYSILSPEWVVSPYSQVLVR